MSTFRTRSSPSEPPPARLASVTPFTSPAQSWPRTRSQGAEHAVVPGAGAAGGGGGGVHAAEGAVTLLRWCCHSRCWRLRSRLRRLRCFSDAIQSQFFNSEGELVETLQVREASEGRRNKIAISDSGKVTVTAVVRGDGGAACALLPALTRWALAGVCAGRGHACGGHEVRVYVRASCASRADAHAAILRCPCGSWGAKWCAWPPCRADRYGGSHSASHSVAC